jgi:hypothetical protein
VSVCRTPLDGTFAGNVPGESGGGEPSDFSHVRMRESPGGEALKRCGVSHRLSAGGLSA